MKLMRMLPLLLLLACGPPDHHPHQLCGTIKEKFQLEKHGYTVLHFSFLPHLEKDRLDMMVHSNFYINHMVGDTICAEFCHYGDCDEHHYDWTR